MPNASPPFVTVRDLAEACGGQTAMADRLGVSASAVNLWVSKDSLPANRLPEVRSLLADSGVQVSTDDLWLLVRPARRRGPAPRPDIAMAGIA